eukprot:m.281366 g.281366  ORF g.281366 m.281366 type:complete len:64 (-) comp152576_c0_seq1:106-297(-)
MVQCASVLCLRGGIAIFVLKTHEGNTSRLSAQLELMVATNFDFDVRFRNYKPQSNTNTKTTNC